MPKFKFVCQVNAVAGQEDAFNEWHTNIHMPEVLAAAGFESGQRLKLVTPDPADGKPYQYLIVYEGECADTSLALEALFQAVGENKVGNSDTLAMPSWMAVYEEIPGAKVTR